MRVSSIRIVLSVLFVAALWGPSAFLAAQTPDGSATGQKAGPPSATLQPSLDALQQALDTLRPDKWKTSGAMREATEANVNSIHHDLDTTLPPLLAAADQAPGSVTAVLPAYRNVEALYDVVLRVTEVSKLSASSQQSMALEEAMARLEEGRRALGDRLQSAASAQEQRVSDLQAAAARAVAPAPAPVAVACPAPAPAKKRTARKKPAQKPATPDTPQGGVPAAAQPRS